jgi:uncharacterized glyoxalase superfamily protein PhnB
MNGEVRIRGAVPVLASLDIERSVAFFVEHLGFTRVYAAAGSYGIVERDGQAVHFWACTERHIAENTSCRLRVSGVDTLYEQVAPRGIVHPNGPLQDTPWGTREFTVVDPDGNAVVFVE